MLGLVLVFLVVPSTSMTKSHKSSAGKSSIRKPASNEWHSWWSRLFIPNSLHKCILSRWAWSAHWLASNTCRLWDSSSRRDSINARRRRPLAGEAFTPSQKTRTFLCFCVCPGIVLDIREGQPSAPSDWHFLEGGGGFKSDGNFYPSSMASPYSHALASRLKKVRVSSDHLPPTSTPKTTNLARLWRPTPDTWRSYCGFFFFATRQTWHIKTNCAQTGHSPNIQTRVSEVPFHIVRKPHQILRIRRGPAETWPPCCGTR